MRRSHSVVEAKTRMKLGPVVLDKERHEVTLDGADIYALQVPPSLDAGEASGQGLHARRTVKKLTDGGRHHDGNIDVRQLDPQEARRGALHRDDRTGRRVQVRGPQLSCRACAQAALARSDVPLPLAGSSSDHALVILLTLATIGLLVLQQYRRACVASWSRVCRTGASPRWSPPRARGRRSPGGSRALRSGGPCDGAPGDSDPR